VDGQERDRIRRLLGLEFDGTKPDGAVVAESELDAEFLERQPVMSKPNKNLLGSFFDSGIFRA
jgi:hypothetical protein